MSLLDKTALLIDDDQELRAIVGRILTNVGMNVRHARTVSEAFSIIKSELPHLIIADLNMQPESGFAFLQRLKADPTAPKVPVIVLSAVIERAAINEAIALGASEYLTKPLRANLLLQKVRKLIKASSFHVIEYSSESMPALTMKIPGTITAGFETGFQVDSSVRIAKGSLVQLESAAISALNFEEPPPMRSPDALPRSSLRGGFLNELRFIGLLEKQISSLKEIFSSWHTR